MSSFTVCKVTISDEGIESISNEFSIKSPFYFTNELECFTIVNDQDKTKATFNLTKDDSGVEYSIDCYESSFGLEVTTCKHHEPFICTPGQKMSGKHKVNSFIKIGSSVKLPDTTIEQHIDNIDKISFEFDKVTYIKKLDSKFWPTLRITYPELFKDYQIGQSIDSSEDKSPVIKRRVRK